MGLWELAAGWGLLPSWFWKDWSEAAEVAVIGRWFQSVIVWDGSECSRPTFQRHRNVLLWTVVVTGNECAGHRHHHHHFLPLPVIIIIIH